MAAEAGVLAILPRVQDLSGSAIVLIKSEVAHIAAKLKYWSYLCLTNLPLVGSPDPRLCEDGLPNLQLLLLAWQHWPHPIL